MYLQVSNNVKPSPTPSNLVNTQASLARPFSSKFTGNDVIGIGLGTTNLHVAMFENSKVIENLKERGAHNQLVVSSPGFLNCG
ncbi:hypothetical protein Pint_07598 [Pistacia integerrima]|uniref:Uncharacterized protein n=1 Tax=Pistacia integerrima TaxID=434235 RepID=A0ACC0XTY4_9ROSI|nr:hypothetical protein Pint_07598 [Pistacia integerrima]